MESGFEAVHTRVFDIQRRVVANRTTLGWQSAPHAAVEVELDLTGLAAHLHRIREKPAFDGVRLTINTLLIRMIAESLKHAPEMNAHIEYSRHTAIGRVFLHDAINIAMPMRMADGRMITPVLEKAGGKNLRETAAALADLRRRADNTPVDLLLREAGIRDSRQLLLRGHFWILWRLFANLLGPDRLPRPDRKAWKEFKRTPASERITPENLTCATIIVSNVGSVLPGVDVRIEMMELIPPQTTAIGIGAMRNMPRVMTDETGRESIEIRKVMPMLICFDHRAMDFEHLTGFIRRIDELCAQPDLIP
jgi:pyruvate/2-oxoglutarate dehydrogenase complex dihydrolipoamide acyltransferase (E2) component